MGESIISDASFARSTLLTCKIDGETWKRNGNTFCVSAKDKLALRCHQEKVGQAYWEPAAELLLDRVTEGAFLDAEHVQHDLHVKESTKEHSPFEHLRRLEVCKIGNHVAWVLEDV